MFLPVPASPISAGNISNSNSSAAPQAPQTTTSTRQTTTTRNANNRQSRPNSIAINNPKTSSSQGSSSNRSATSNQNTLPPATTLPNTNLQPALPPAPPEPELAKNVTVMGVIQIGEQTQAIVQVPSEATSRYVQVGQRLSNGQVLVKRIELNAGAEPLVILEQYGVEVSKAVGEVAPNQGEQTTPTAAVPSLPLPSAELPASLQNTSTPTAAVPYPPSPSTSTPRAELPAPPQNINISGVNISAPQPLPNTPVTATK